MKLTNITGDIHFTFLNKVEKILVLFSFKNIFQTNKMWFDRFFTSIVKLPICIICKHFTNILYIGYFIVNDTAKYFENHEKYGNTLVS